MKSLIWFRRDLRVTDNSALYHAAKNASVGVIGVYFVTPKQWKQHDDANCKIQFWINNLSELSVSLAKLNIPLLIKNCDTFQQIPQTILKLAKQHLCDQLFFNREYEANEVARDDQVLAQFRRNQIPVQRYHDRIIVPPKEIETKQGNFYSVFTPYRRVWDTRVGEFSKPFPKPRKQPETKIKSDPIPEKVKGYKFSDVQDALWPAGEAEAQKRLKRFSKKASSYQTDRDLPAVPGTSLLSPYLVAGVVSPRQCLAAVMKATNDQTSTDKVANESPTNKSPTNKSPTNESPTNEGATVWVSELTWRDFYVHVMTGFPRVSMHQPFKLKTNEIPWRNHADDFTSWKTGQTGYPIVDAGMRQLNQTGWMHNRLRMVTAMFLTKNLLIDWRLGEQYFMQTLIDGDLAANNGGWQWSASTGTDAVPYFRIFNPFSQSKRFDRDGTFIKKMCPELESVPAKCLHDPEKLRSAIAERSIQYPGFIVDYKTGRERALAAFKSLN